MAMNRFLVSCQQLIKASSQSLRLVAVLGNESADMDSVACALVHARVLSEANKADKSRAFIPVVNIPRKDLPLRTEVTHVLRKLGIEDGNLIFFEEFNAKARHDSGLLDVVLVDHNRLNQQQELYGSAVISIVDHHQDERLYSHAKSKIEQVGSCSSLIAQHAAVVGVALSLEEMELLVSAILIDTVNLDASKTRCEPLDVLIAGNLLSSLGQDRQRLFEECMRAKCDSSSLGTFDLLRRDYKQVTVGSHTFGIAALAGLDLDTFFKRTNIMSEVQQFIDGQGIGIFVIMTGFQLPEAPFRRQLCIFSDEKNLLEGLANALLHSDLRLEPSNQLLALCFEQRNTKLSRKFVLPAVSDFLRSV